MSQKLLDVENLTMKFGGLVAIDNLSFSADKDKITSIIGPNGAGKTTVFNCLTGFYKATAGSMFLNKENEILNLRKFSYFKVAQKAGVARTFQNIRLFPQMSVLENLMVAQHNKLMDASGFTILGLFNSPSFVKKEKEAVEISKYWLDIIGLTHRADDDAGDLPYGDQRKLEIVRAMCINPHLLCLDEPAAGLNAKESAELNKLLLFIKNEKKTGILLIEHDMSVVMEISDHVVVLNYGKNAAQVKANITIVRFLAYYYGLCVETNLNFKAKNSKGKEVDLYTYVLDFLSLHFQKPGVKVRNCICFHSEEKQLGKNTLFDIVIETINEAKSNVNHLSSVTRQIPTSLYTNTLYQQAKNLLHQ